MYETEPKLSFKEFKEILQKIMDISDAEDRINNICRDLNYKYKEYSEAGRLPSMATDTVHLMSKLLGDDNDWIGYWCWEKNFGRRTDLNVYDTDNTIIPSTTIEDLWHLVTGQYPDDDK